MPTNDVPVTTKKTGLQRSAKMTLQEQLVSILTEQIEKGIYRTGDRMPSVRHLAETYEVSRETAKLALGTMQEAGLVEILPSRGAYVKDPQANDTVQQKNSMIGVLLPIGDADDAVHDLQLIYDSLLRTLDSEAVRYNQHIITAYIDTTKPDGLERMNSMIEKIDGLFVIGVYTEEFLDHLKDLPIPVISILANIDVDLIDDINCENVKSYRAAAEQLIRTGCKDIVFADGPVLHYQSERRYEGCEQAATAAGSGIEVLSCPGWTAEEARVGFAGLLERKTPDGVICVNDITAVGIMQACRDAGLRIPEDISIIGAKNTLLSKSMDPPLSSIECYFDEIAKIAMERLDKRISGINYRPAKMEIAGDVIIRETCRNHKS